MDLIALWVGRIVLLMGALVVLVWIANWTLERLIVVTGNYDAVMRFILAGGHKRKPKRKEPDHAQG